MDNNKYQRKSFRLQRYNYSWPGCYFVTICTKDKEFVLSEIKNQNVVLNKYGQIVENVLQMSFRKYQHVSLDNYVIMPNHIHAIIKLNTAYIDHVDKDPYKRRNMLLSKFVGYFKMNSSKKINIILNNSGNAFWQRNYYEKIISNEVQLKVVREYIINNPKNWIQDRNNQK